MNTVDNLKEAFAGESQANQKYRAFAKRAEKDGLSMLTVRVVLVITIKKLMPRQMGMINAPTAVL